MKFDILTLFPEMFTPIELSMIGRAEKNGLVSFNIVNIRDYSQDKHKKTDDTPFGGGHGMVMMTDPIFRAMKDIGVEPGKPHRKVIYMSPRGKVLDHEKIEELSREDELVILCGHYEGVDERVLEEIVDEYISIGDYVLTGGEIPAMAVVDAVSRMVPGVLSEDICFEEESHYSGTLEHPQYTKPYQWHGKCVPEVLISGHHANIEKWKIENSFKETTKYRPDLLPDFMFDD